MSATSSIKGRLTICRAVISTLLALPAVPGSLRYSGESDGAPQAASQPLQIDWTKAERAARAPISEVNRQFIGANRKAIDQTPLPILIPSDPDLAAGLRFFQHGESYTVSSKTATMAFTLTGSARAFPLPPAAQTQSRGGLKTLIPADGVLIEHSESGIDASFSRFGAAYAVSLECTDVAKDSRCAHDTYVRGVISRLAVVVPVQGH